MKPNKLIAIPLFGMLLLSGCATHTNILTMQSVDKRRDFTQVFSAAYSALNPDGDYDIVLVHDANAEVTDRGDDTVLTPTTVSPRQIMHVRVFWIPEKGTKLDHPVASNSAIRWYVFGDRLDESAELLEYSGGGLVLVAEHNGKAKITIRGAFLKVTTRRGEMADPLGPCSVNGSIISTIDRHRVDELLGEAKQADQNAPQATTN